MILARPKRLIACLFAVSMSYACNTAGPEPDLTIDPALWRADLEYLKLQFAETTPECLSRNFPRIL